MAHEPIRRNYDAPWHRLYFLPLPQGQGSFLPTLRPPVLASNCKLSVRRLVQPAQVHAGGWSAYQLPRSLPMTMGRSSPIKVLLAPKVYADAQRPSTKPHNGQG